MRGLSAALLVLVGSSIAGCDTRPASMGKENRFVVGVHGDLWDQISDDVYDALEVRVFTTRPEKTFELTYQDPRETTAWHRLKNFRRVLIIGSEQEPWVAAVLAAHSGPAPTPPSIVQVDGVWARGQQVTLLLVPESQEVEATIGLLPELHVLLDTQYRSWVQRRMYLTPPDTALATTLATQYGFSVLVPEVYKWSALDSVVRLRNDNPSPAELIRELIITWRPIDETPMTAEAIGEWRAAIALTALAEAQVVDTISELEMVEVEGRNLSQIWGVWRDQDPAWPATGPFKTRIVPCPMQGRVFLVDSWLYAPGVDKYQYLIQLETLLDTFRCGARGE